MEGQLIADPCRLFLTVPAFLILYGFMVKN